MINHIIYRFPGMGADHRLFYKVEPIPGIRFVDIMWDTSISFRSLGSYAKKIVSKIDESVPYSFFGVSLGGMIAIELAEILSPEKIIILSSAKGQDELPSFVKNNMMRYIPNTLVKKGIEKMLPNSARFFGQMSEDDKTIFYQMSADTNVEFISRFVRALAKWQRKGSNKEIIHYHGTRDFVIPFPGERRALKVPGGDHMVIFNKANWVNEMLQFHFKEYNN